MEYISFDSVLIARSINIKGTHFERGFKILKFFFVSSTVSLTKDVAKKASEIIVLPKEL